VAGRHQSSSSSGPSTWWMRPLEGRVVQTALNPVQLLLEVVCSYPLAGFGYDKTPAGDESGEGLRSGESRLGRALMPFAEHQIVGLVVAATAAQP